MKRKSIISLLCLAFATCVFAGCEQISGLFGGEQEEPHTHTYATEWSKDKEGHWYDATCECEDVEITKIAHVDKNNDSLCDICEYDYNHTHTYEEDTWTVNCEQHWHAATCGHVVVGIDAADHADENADGKCDTCGYVIEDIHVHVYEDDVWVTDGEYHWHAALCEHKAEIADKEAHVLNAAGDCTVCGENVNPVDVTKIEAVLAAAQANEYKIVDGAVIADVEVYGGTGKEDLEQSSTDEVYFVLGNSETYIKTKSETIDYTQNSSGSGVEEEWYQDLGNDDIFGVILEDGAEELAPTMGSAQKMKGYNYIPGSILPSDADDTSTLANTLSGLYNQMKAGVRVSNAKESVKDGVYTFSYTYYSVNANTSSTTANGDGTGAVTSTKVNSVEIELYNAQVEFTVNEDLIIDAATFSVEVYRDYDADSDLLYTYVDNGDGTVTLTSEVTLKDTANPSVYTFNVAQHSGVRTFTTPYPRSSLIPTSFEFSYINEYDYPDAFDFQIISETLIGDSLTLQEGEYAYFHIGDLKPITASSKFMSTEDFTYTFVNKDSSSTAICWDVNDTLLNGYSQYIDCLKLKILDPGEYTVTITFGNMSKTFDVTVKAEELPEVGDDDDANTINVATTDTYTFSEDDLFSYTAAEEGTYIFNLPAGLGFWSRESYDSYGAPEMDFYDNVNGESVEFDLAAGETLEFYVGAITKGTWVITVEFEVGGGDEGGNEGGGETSGTIGNIVGTYYSGTCVLVINDDGTMTFTNGSTVSNYTYEINGNTVTYTLNGNAPYTSDNPMAVYFGYLTFDSDGMPATFVNNGTTYALTTEGGSEDEGGNGGEVDYETIIVAGTNTLYFSAEEISADTAERTATIEVAGNYSFSSGILFVGSVTDSTGAAVTKNDDYTYTLAAGTYTVKFSMLGMFGASADTAIELNVENTSATEEDDGETEGGEEGGNGSGTSADPYVITELPFEVTFESTHDVYYTYTATEACTLSITCPAGCLVSGTGATKDDAGNYTVVVAAGQTLSINPWSNGGTAPYTYTISKVEVVEPTPGEGEEGGEVVGNSVVYLGANGSGRAMQITVDATAGTVSVIRAALAGNSLNTASGATEYTGTYSYDGSAVTCEISGCTITWNADGSPASVVWGSATYTDFTVQA